MAERAGALAGLAGPSRARERGPYRRVIGFLVLVLLILPPWAKTERPAAAIPGRLGDLIVYESDKGGDNEIWIVNRDGSHAEPLTENDADDGRPSWAAPITDPDPCNAPPQQIAFQSNRDGDYEIWVMNGDGTNQHAVTDNSANDTSPAWSPDEKVLGSVRPDPLIAFESDRDGNQEIYVMRPDGTGQRRLTQNAADDGNPSWSPDGSQIVFESNRSGTYQIHVMDVPDTGLGTGLHRVTAGRQQKFNPNWIDGLGFNEEGDEFSIDLIAYEVREGGGYNIYSAMPDGTGATRLTNSPGEDAAPAWSPNAEFLTYQSTKDGSYDVYVMENDGALQTRLSQPYSSDERNPDWQPRSEECDIIFGDAPNPGPSGGRSCTKSGGPGANKLVGTSGPDVLCGKGGPDILRGLGGRDLIHGGGGRDAIQGGTGTDTFSAKDNLRDRIRGGPGSDRGYVDRGLDRLVSVEARD
jgi:Ca2+-binding RTX toxin-like protein